MAAKARAAGVPEGSIGVMRGYYRAARAGEFEVINDTLARILGRAPETMGTFLGANL